MIRRLFLLFFVVLCQIGYAQNSQILQNTGLSNTNNNLRFVPSNIDPQSVNPSDVPSEEVLRKMGLNEEEIAEALDFKFQRGKYDPNFSELDSSNFINNQNSKQLLYNSISRLEYNDSILYPLGMVYGQDLFRTNELSFFNRAFDAQAPDNYLLGENDELTISIWGLAEHSEIVTVNDKGYIQTEYAGRIYVGSKNFKKVKSLVKSRMANYFDLNKSQFDLTLNYSRVITVNIVGEVFNPGSYTFPATNTAFNALMAAGGPNQLGSVRNIYIKRDGKTVDSLDVYKFMFDPTSNQDVFLQNNDYILVGNTAKVVDISGEVNRPYTYEVKSGDNLNQLITYSGGFTKNAYTGAIFISRLIDNSKQTITINKEDFDSFQIENGDEVIISKAPELEKNYVEVQTSTGVSGKYQFNKDLTVFDLLTSSQSLTDELYFEKAYIIRTLEDFSKDYIILDIKKIIENPSSLFNLTLEEYDELHFLSKRDFLDEYEVKVSGGVRDAGSFNYGNGASLGDIILLSGGFVQEAAGGKVEIFRTVSYDLELNQISPRKTTVKSFKINKLGLLDDAALSFQLSPFDHVAVRVNPAYEPIQTISISGNVLYPGEYTIENKTQKIADLIDQAGGVEAFGDLGSSKVYRLTTIESSTIDEFIAINKDDEVVNGFYSDGQFVEIVSLNQNVSAELDTSISMITAYIPISINLRKALKNRKSKHNIYLQDGDRIVIPSLENIVTITGAIKNLKNSTISTPFFKRRANYYVNNFAGGFSKHNVKDETYVLYPSGSIKKARNFGLFILYPKVKNGATIKVTEDVKIKRVKSEPVDWTKIIESTVTKITGIASLYILYLSRQ
jgi:protein involved in polysaccharide export with SLBB domain